MAEATPKYVRYKGEHWDALYVDGKLDLTGDGYLIDERLETLVGVDVRSGDSFFMGGKDYNDVATSLEAVEAYDAEYQAGLVAAQEQLAQAEAAYRQAQADLQVAQAHH